VNQSHLRFRQGASAGTALSVSLSDHVLIELTRQGNRGAFDELIRRHRPKCIAVALFFLRDYEDAEDEVQNALLNAFAHLDQFRNDASFEVWLTRIVSNQCLMVLRRRHYHFVYLDGTSPTRDTAPPELPACGSDPEGGLVVQQTTTVLMNEIHRIPPLLRDPLVLRHVQELPIADVAKKLGITTSAAKSRIQRAKAELRARLTQRDLTKDNVSSFWRSGAPFEKVARHQELRPLQAHG
jgi:RNA polymerase sigma-70 factor (ECF subfamily)